MEKSNEPIEKNYMPAKSQAQRAYLNMEFGHNWVKKHGFDNKGKLPEHVGGKRHWQKGKRHHMTRP